MAPRTLFTALITLTTLFSPPALSTSSITPKLTHAFTLHANLGAPLKPIPVAGGVTLVEPIVGGTLSGSMFNGKVTSGSAVVTDTANLTVANPMISIYGNADDGSSFYAQCTGVGAPGEQFARVVLSISGKYAPLANEFILASFTDNDQNPPTKSTIEAWVVSRE